MELQPGLMAERQHVVQLTDVATHLGPSATSAFSTPNLILLMELTALDAVAPCLSPEQVTVGIAVDIRHLAPTPVGMRVRCRAKLLEIAGRRLIFQVQVWDERELVGQGIHERAVVDVANFRDRLAQKQV